MSGFKFPSSESPDSRGMRNADLMLQGDHFQDVSRFLDSSDLLISETCSASTLGSMQLRMNRSQGRLQMVKTNTRRVLAQVMEKMSFGYWPVGSLESHDVSEGRR